MVKRGRKSGDDFRQELTLALRNIDEVSNLEKSSLGRLPAVRLLAETRYRDTLYPAGFAVRHLLQESVDKVAKDLGNLPCYARQVQFLQQFSQGASVTQISHGLGISREHVSREIQKEALSLLQHALIKKASREESGAADLHQEVR